MEEIVKQINIQVHTRDIVDRYVSVNKQAEVAARISIPVVRQTAILSILSARTIDNLTQGS